MMMVGRQLVGPAFIGSDDGIAASLPVVGTSCLAVLVGGPLYDSLEVDDRAEDVSFELQIAENAVVGIRRETELEIQYVLQ